MRYFQYIIKNHDKEKNLLDFLSTKFTYHSKIEWLEEIQNKNILLNQNIPDPNSVLSLDDEIIYIKNDFQEPAVDTNFSVIFEDKNLLIINKPGNLPVHPSGRYKENTLLTLLKKYYREESLFPIHRLDRETSGIQIFAKNKEISSKLQIEFERKNILKEYIVYVHGVFPPFLQINGTLSKAEDSKIRKKRILIDLLTQSKNYVETKCILLESKFNLSKLQVIPRTGKYHQIRCSLFTRGYPVVGDKLYGLHEDHFLELLKGKNFIEFGIGRQALHASRIVIPNYNQLDISCEEPEDMTLIFPSAEK